MPASEIPIGSRIVAIADAYEAMISDRPYSPAMAHQAAIEELKRQRGSQFDPDLVDVFVALAGDGMTETGERYGVPAFGPTGASRQPAVPAVRGRPGSPSRADAEKSSSRRVLSS